MKQSAKKSKQQPQAGTVDTVETVAFESNPIRVVIKGWEWLFTCNRTPAIVLLVLSVITGFSQFRPVGQPSGQQTPPATAEAVAFDARMALLILAVVLVAFFILVLLTTLFNGILGYISWKTSRQETTTFNEAIKAVMAKFWIIFGVYVRVSLKTIGGLLLLIVPGIRAILRYQLVLFPVFEEDLKGAQALERSKELADKHLMEILGVTAAASLIRFVNLPLQTGGEAVLFRQLKELHKSGAPGPKTHWVNYAVFIVTAAFTAAMIAVAFLAVSSAAS